MCSTQPVKIYNGFLLENEHEIYSQSWFLFSELDTKTQNLSMMSQKYKKDATYLNTKSMLVKVTAGAVILLVIVLYFWVL